MHAYIKPMVVKLVWMSTNYLVSFFALYEVYMVYNVYTGILHSDCNLVLSIFCVLAFTLFKIFYNDYVIKDFNA